MAFFGARCTSLWARHGWAVYYGFLIDCGIYDRVWRPLYCTLLCLRSVGKMQALSASEVQFTSRGFK